MNSPCWSARRGANLHQTPAFIIVEREYGYSVFFVATGLPSEGDSLDRLSYRMEGVKVVISSRMQVMKQRGAASQEGFVNDCSLPNGINTVPGKPGMASHQ
jgi:hypothetical protein